MSDPWQRRLDRLVDPAMARTDPQYALMTSLFRRWLHTAEDAMRDEEVDREVIERVLERMVYGTPHAADAYERVEVHKQRVQEAMRGARLPPTFSRRSF